MILISFIQIGDVKMAYEKAESMIFASDYGILADGITDETDTMNRGG
jgi:hypothetical protein